MLFLLFLQHLVVNPNYTKYIYPDKQDAFSRIFLCICEYVLVLQTWESVKSYKMTFTNSFKGKKKEKEKNQT